MDYNSALARVAALKAKDDFNVGFEARATKPLLEVSMSLMMTV